ncbi:hypothetical protein JMJ99_04475 [Companilactobacillus zhachilii]|jgi:Predicted pyrophosphatase|uniref:MazG nucleotide pyrophosphohydrolase domain-containing protein n=1 Tax=Companilactobacillus zhachilii TaxID=2304606 RepID=UPI0019239E20|nr:MazG-like family protein [Companilactobacillus zhachilii]MBL3530615.1 hypothetical protein [Companilactobacillus zhachilii]
MSNLKDHQAWLKEFYEGRGWYQYPTFIHLNFVTEEVGELSRAVRALEIGRDHPGEAKKTHEELMDNLEEELADVLDQVLMISSKYDVNPETLLKRSEVKLTKRFKPLEKSVTSSSKI